MIEAGELYRRTGCPPVLLRGQLWPVARCGGPPPFAIMGTTVRSRGNVTPIAAARESRSTIVRRGDILSYVGERGAAAPEGGRRLVTERAEQRQGDAARRPRGGPGL